jgi:hypothetical protein
MSKSEQMKLWILFLFYASKLSAYHMKNIMISSLVCIFLLLQSCNKQNNEPGIVFENSDFKLVIGNDGTAASLRHMPTGMELLQKGIKMSAFALTQDRPYDNELQLSYPSKPKTFAADSAWIKDGDLYVSFRPERNIARIGVKVTDHYIGFTLKGFGYDYKDLRGKRQTEIDEFTILQLPVAELENFGEWLNVSWDDKVAVNLLGLGTKTMIDAEERDGYRIFRAAASAEAGMNGVSAALIATTKDELMNRISTVEMDYNLPNGVKSRMSPEYKYSYYEASRVTPSTIDRHIGMARQGGFRAFMIHYFSFAVSLGHFPWLPEYPNGIDDLKLIVKKISDAGMVPGFHIHYSKVMNNDPYVTPVPDPRLNLSRRFTLSQAINQQSDSIVVEESPEGCTMEGGRRMLKLGDEIIEYTKYTSGRPYTFLGCKRGIFGTKPSLAMKGTKFGLLDVDTWTMFIRIDQATSLQEELAGNLARIANDAGFRFIYFDGAEDVHPPYWYNIGNSQYEVYKRLSPEILFAEGAAKAHFSWHMLTRGNAFDVFRPEIFKEAIRTYHAKEAAFVANDFSSINFGWIEHYLPDEKSTGIQPDMLEYAWSRAAAWDCPASLNGKLQLLLPHPRLDDNLQSIKRWEDARLSGYFTESMKEQLKILSQEHTMLIDENGNFEMQPWNQVSGFPVDSSAIRAFEFKRNGKSWIAYWNTYGNSEMLLEINGKDIKLCKDLGKDMSFKNEGNGVLLPAGERLYIETSLPADQIRNAIKNARIRDPR